MLFLLWIFEFISGFCGKFEISMEFLRFEEILIKNVGVDGEIEFRNKK